MDEKASERTGFGHGPQIWLVFLLTLGEFLLLYTVFFIDVPTPNKELAYALTGAYSAKWGDAVAYWYNSTYGSTKKNEIIAKAQPIT